MSEEIVERVCKFAFDRERLAINIDTEVGLTILDEIVRCRDCAYGYVAEYEGEADGRIYRAKYATCSAMGANEWPYRTFRVEPDGFCAWGKRRCS